MLIEDKRIYRTYIGTRERFKKKIAAIDPNSNPDQVAVGMRIHKMRALPTNAIIYSTYRAPMVRITPCPISPYLMHGVG